MLKSQVSEGREAVCCARDGEADPLRLLQRAIGCGAHNKQLSQLRAEEDKSQRLAHLSKRTRIELIGAHNDHNYNLPSPKLGSSSSASSQSRGELEAMAKEALGGLEAGQWAKEPAEGAKEERMDDCMAAMVLMFLSCNNEQLKLADEPHTGAHSKGESLQIRLAICIRQLSEWVSGAPALASGGRRRAAALRKLRTHWH